MNEVHTGDNLAARLRSILEKWSVQEKVSFVMQDSAANMIKMANLLDLNHGDCCNHSLQLVVKESILISRTHR